MPYTCPRCGRVSYNPHDAEHRFCGACHQFEDGRPEFRYRAGAKMPIVWGDWDYTLRIYAPTHQGGHLLLETTHRGVASKDIELQVCRARMAKGEVGRVEVLDHKACTTTVVSA